MKDLFDVQQLTQFEFGAILISVLVAGLVFGCLIAYGLLNRKNSPNAAAAVKIQEEFEEYKEKVDTHFNQTSEMFKDVTTQYKKLYDHMAVGAIELSNADTITMPRLEMQENDDQAASENAAPTDADPSADSTIDEEVVETTDETNAGEVKVDEDSPTTQNPDTVAQETADKIDETLEHNEKSEPTISAANKAG